MNNIDPGWNGRDPYEEEDLRMQQAKKLADRCSYKPKTKHPPLVFLFDVFVIFILFAIGWFSMVAIVSIIRFVLQR